MLIDAGLPISGTTYSNYEIASVLVPSAEISDGTSGPPLKFLRFREASQTIEDFVFKFDMFQVITADEDLSTAYTLWYTIQDNMFDFMNKISSLTSQVDDGFIELGVQQQNLSNVDTSVMKKLYLDIFNETVNAVSSSSASYTGIFNLLKKYCLDFQKKTEQVSEYYRFKLFDLLLIN